MYCFNRVTTLTEIPAFTELRTRISQELVDFHKSVPMQPADLQSYYWASTVLLMSGDRKHTEELWKDVQVISSHVNDINSNVLSFSIDGIKATLDGRLEEAVEYSNKIWKTIEGANIPGIGLLWVRDTGLRAHIYRGISPEDLELWHPGFWDTDTTYAASWQCLMYAHCQQVENANDILDKNVVEREGIGTKDDNTQVWMDTFYFESSVLIKHKKAAELLYNRMNVSGLCTNGIHATSSIPRHLGGAAILLGKYDKAKEHYKESLRICTKMNFRPELALTHLNYAELLLDHYPKEKAEALEHLDFAIKEFREMKMQPSLERALRRKDILKA